MNSAKTATQSKNRRLMPAKTASALKQSSNLSAVHSITASASGPARSNRELRGA